MLARALHDKPTAEAYARLSQFAARNARNEFGARAALALGYEDLQKNRFAQARKWLAKAERDAVLREYALYWEAQTAREQSRDSEALERLEAFRREFPDSVMSDQAIQTLVQAALALGKAGEALAAMQDYPDITAKPWLLLLRAQARSQAEQLADAASDYLSIYYDYPLSDEARVAEAEIPSLMRKLGDAFPKEALDLRVGRAQMLYDARRWREGLEDEERLLPDVSGEELEQTGLRLAEIRVQLGGEPGLLSGVSLTDPDLDAERLYALSQAYRSGKQETEMLETIEQLASRYPGNPWTEEALFAAGNYYWVNLDRDHAATFYRRALTMFPDGKNALTAQWRVAWTAYLERQPDAAALLEEHLRRFAGSSYVPDALYFLGRLNERAGELAEARAFYQKAEDRFPQTYFGEKAAERLRPAPAGIGAAPADPPEVLAQIPAAPPPPRLDDPIPEAAAARWARAQALRSIAFDASAELELRAAYAETHVRRLLWEAALAALGADHYAVGISAMRLALPQLEARHIEDLPREVWRTAFPLPFEAEVKHTASSARLDPMFVAAVIRQESVFQPEAVSRAGAIGLMQVLPKTGWKMARRLRVRYNRARLFDPEYNLRLGTLYLADLLQAYGTPEAALAAFNAGEDRVEAWTTGQKYEETPEFVESIPFTETREYVQIVMRNAEIYRQLYAGPSK